MKSFNGSCHCGKVTFEIKAEKVSPIVDCNCSICTKKGVLHYRVDPENFDFHADEKDLGEYQFHTKAAKHFFCQHCGIHTFNIPRNAPDKYNINVRCLDDFDDIRKAAEIKEFDGKSWD